MSHPLRAFFRAAFHYAVLGVLLGAISGAHPQERGADPETVIERYQAYLARAPFKERGFDKMVEAAVSINGLGGLVSAYEERLQGAAPAMADRVILARLYARTERTDEALEALAEVTPESAELLRLRGTLLVSVRRVEEGLAALDGAVALTEDRDVLEELHVRRGEARLAAGMAEEARAAFADLVALDPQDARLRSDAADALARSGLTAAALEEYSAAAELVADDAPRLCRVLSELGRLQERIDAPLDALATYARATAQLGRGHWLRRDLEARVVSIHRRSGSLPAFAEEVRASLAAVPRDLALRELLARTLVDLKALDEARDVLATGTQDFPQDLPLARKHLEVLELLDDADARVAEYQRVLAEHPEELELVIELGQVFASDGRLDQARLQWERSLDERLQDPGLCLRLAALHALYEMPAEATRLIEKAIALEPRELGHYAELATLLVRQDRRAEVATVLDRAEQAAGDDAGRLETLSDLARGYRDLERAERALVRARVGRETDPRLARSLASLLVERGDPERAGEVLRSLIENAPDATTRRDAADRLVRLHRRRGTLDELVDDLEKAVEADGTNLASLYLAAAVARRRGDDDRARPYLEKIVELAPDDEGARDMLAALLHDRGDDAGAIAQYEALMELRPRSRARYLKDIARIHVDERREPEALACYAEVLDLSPDNPATFREVAQAYVALGRHEEAAESLRQAARLRPDDGDIRMQLASTYEALDDLERAENEVLLAAADDDPGVVARARGWLYNRMVDEGTVDSEIAQLRDAIRANPYDAEKPLVLVDLFTRELEYELALDLIAELLTFRPTDVELLRHRARLQEDMERWEEAIADYETLRKLPGGEGDDLVYELAECYLQLGDRRVADKLLLEAGDLSRTASLYQRNGLPKEARAALEKALALAPDDRQLLLRLVSLHQETREFEAARAAYERVIALDGETFDHLKRLATLLQRAGDTAAFNATCKRMFATVEPVTEPADGTKKERRSALRRSRGRANKRLGEIRSFVYELQLWEAYGELAYQALLENPMHPLIVEQGLSELVNNQRGREALDTLAFLRKETLDAERVPAGYDASTWRRYLDNREKLVYRNDAELAALRAAELGTGETLSEDEIKELIELYKRQEQNEELITLLEGAVERFPENRKYLGGLAITLMFERLYDEAEPRLRTLLDLSERSSIARSREPRMSRNYARTLEKRMPEELFARKTDELLELHHRLGVRASVRDSWSVGSTPRAVDVQMQLAACLIELDQEAEAREIYKTFEPAHPDLAQVAAQMSAIYRALGWDADAERMDELVWAAVQRVEDEPFLQHKRRWPPAIMSVVEVRLDAQEATGDVSEQWELRRRWQGAERAEALLARRDARGEVTEARFAAWQAALAAAPEGAAVGLRRAGLLAAELLRSSDRHEEAIAIYRELYEREPEDLVLLDVLARLEERAGRIDAALALYAAGIEAARARVIESGKIPPVASMAATFMDEPESPDPYVLVPERPNPGSSDESLYQQIEQAGSFGTPTAPKPEDWQPWGLVTSVFRVHWEARNWAQAGEVLEELNKHNQNVLGWAGWQLTRALEREKAGAEALTIYRLLYDSNSNDDDSVEAYGRALIDAGREEDAKRVYKKYLRGRQVNPRDSVARALAEIEPVEEGPGMPELPADLLAAVEADPKNVRLRTALVRRLLEEGDFAAAAEHAVEAERMAPHLDEVRDLARNTLLVAGRDAEFEERLREAARRSQDDDVRLGHALMLARILRLRGEEDAAAEVVIAGIRGQGRSDYSGANFFLEAGRLDLARAQLERELEARSGKGSWETQQLRSALARVAAVQGDPLPGLENAWEEAGQYGQRTLNAELLSNFVARIREVSDVAAAAAVVEAAAEGLDARRARAYRFAAARARDGHAETEELLLEFGLSEPGLRPLAVNAVQEARARKDWAAAERYLGVIAERVSISERKQVQTSLGSISERQALLTEIGTLRQAAGDFAGARAQWEEAFEGDSKRSWHLAQLHAEHGRYDDARREFDVWLAKRTRKEADEPLLDAALLAHAGDYAGAIKQLELARLSTSGRAPEHDAGILDELAALHRRLGRLDQWIERVERMRLEAPTDSALAQRLLGLVEEHRGAEAADDLLLSWKEHAQSYGSWLLARGKAAVKRGDPTRALALFEASSQADPDSFARRIGEDRAGALWDLGREDEALAELLGDDDDTEGHHAFAVVRFLHRRKEHERVVEWAQRAVASDEAPTWWELDPYMRSLDALDRKEEALEVVLDHLRHATAAANGAGWIRRLAGARPVLAEAEARLAEQPDDEHLRTVVALLAYQLDQPARAAKVMEQVLADNPRHSLCRGFLWRAYQKLERFEDAFAELEATIDRLDRARMIGDSEGARTLDNLRRERSLLALRVHGPERAAATWRDGLGTRFAKPNLNKLRYYQLFNDVPRELDWFWTYGLWEQYLSAQDVLVGPEHLRLDPSRRHRAEIRSGAVETGLAGLWQSRANTQVVGPLVSAFYELGRLDELEELLARDPQDSAAVQGAVNRLRGRWGAELARIRAARGTEDAHGSGLLDEADLARRAGDLDDAWASVERWLAERSADAFGGGQLPWFRREGALGETTFDFGSAQGNDLQTLSALGYAGGILASSGSISFAVAEEPHRSGATQTARQGLAAALAWRTGHAALAAELEAEDLAELTTNGQTRALRTLAALYADHGALDAAERLYLASLDAHPNDELALLRELTRMFHWNGAAERRDAYAARWLAAHGALEESVGRLWERAGFRAVYAQDLALARAELARAQELDPDGDEAPGLMSRAWLFLRLGRAEEALALFGEQAELDRWEGRLQRPTADLLYGLAQAQLAARGLDAAAPALRRALAEFPQDVRAAEVRAALGE